MSNINNASTPCPPGWDPVEWQRHLDDKAAHDVLENQERQYQQALDDGAEPFAGYKAKPCPPDCDPVEWNRVQQDNEMFAHQDHVEATLAQHNPREDEQDELRDDAQEGPSRAKYR